MTISPALLVQAEQLRTILDSEGHPASAAVVTSLVSELTAATESLAERDREAAENVAHEFAKQRVAHYRDRAHIAEERVTRANAVLSQMETDGNPAAPHLKEALR